MASYDLPSEAGRDGWGAGLDRAWKTAGDETAERHHAEERLLV